MLKNKLTKDNKFSLKFNLFDIIVGLVAVSLAVILIVVNNIVFFNSKDMNDKVAYIYYDSKVIHTIYFKDMESKEEYKIILKKDNYPLINSDMIILISKENGIKVDEEESPQKICSRQGWVSQTDMPVVCLPNNVWVEIKDINDIDLGIMLQ